MNRKLFLLGLCLAFFITTSFAQAYNRGNAKLNLIVGEFSGDYSNVQRSNVVQELIKGHRANVIDLHVYNSLPKSVQSKMHIDAVVTGSCKLSTERKEHTRTQRDGSKKLVVEYNSVMVTGLYLKDPINDKVIVYATFTNRSSDENRNESVKKAIRLGSTDGKKLALLLKQTLTLDEYLQETFPLHGRIVTLDEFKKNKADVVTINLGGRDAVYRGQTFEVVGEKKNYGRLRVREINGDSLATCRVEDKGKEIFSELEKGATLELVSYVQAVNLNGLVYNTEQEAPRLTASSVNDSKRRNVAFGRILGGAPSEFVNSVKQQMDVNSRINAYQLGEAGCPELSSLDGIVYGYYTGMHSSSRLVKAEDHVLQLKDYTEYSTTVNWYLYIVDPNTGEITYSDDCSYTATSSKSANEATDDAIRGAANIVTATYRAYPLIGTIITIDESDQKRAKSVTIDLGKNFPVYKDLRFDVYSQNANSDWEKIGRVVIVNIVDGIHATCTVKDGGDKISHAMEENLPVRITSYTLRDF